MNVFIRKRIDSKRKREDILCGERGSVAVDGDGDGGRWWPMTTEPYIEKSLMEILRLLTYDVEMMNDVNGKKQGKSKGLLFESYKCYSQGYVNEQNIVTWYQ